MSAARPPEGANCAPAGGSEAAKLRAWGDHTSAARPPEGAHAPVGGGEGADAHAWGTH